MVQANATVADDPDDSDDEIIQTHQTKESSGWICVNCTHLNPPLGKVFPQTLT